MSENEGLTPRQRRFVAAMLSEKTIRAAAKRAGVSEATAGRWLALPAVRRAIEAAEAEALAELSRGLLRLSTQTINAIEIVLTSEAAPSVRLRAADIVLSRLLHYVEFVSLERRVSEIEQRLGGE